MTKMIVNGYRGRLGSAICKAAEAQPDVEVIAGIDISGSSSQYRFATYGKISDCDVAADVIIECSIASAVPDALSYAVSRNIPIVVCTTGLEDGTFKILEEASTKIAVFKSANMSLGINLISELLEKAVRVLGDSGFDIEIIEKHHNQKTDAPSGTALMLADVINNASDGKYHYVYDRSKTRQKRDSNEIGIHAVRGGTIVGDHSIVFAGLDEIIEIKHEAHSKEVFAIGALKAAKYISAKAPGLYDMRKLMQEA